MPSFICLSGQVWMDSVPTRSTGETLIRYLHRFHALENLDSSKHLVMSHLHSLQKKPVFAPCPWLHTTCHNWEISCFILTRCVGQLCICVSASAQNDILHQCQAQYSLQVLPFRALKIKRHTYRGLLLLYFEGKFLLISAMVQLPLVHLTQTFLEVFSWCVYDLRVVWH